MFSRPDLVISNSMTKSITENKNVKTPIASGSHMKLKYRKGNMKITTNIMIMGNVASSSFISRISGIITRSTIKVATNLKDRTTFAIGWV